MAKILFGNMIADARGKMGGVVYSRNTYGAYARQKVSPVQPRSATQLNQRNRLVAQSKDWGSISQAARDAWGSFALTHPIRDVFGLSKNLSGQAMFMKLNLGLSSNGLPALVDPPTNLDVTSVTGITVANATSGALSVVEMTDFGTDYTDAPAVDLSAGDGAGATATAFLFPSSVDTVDVGAGGTGYTSPPGVVFTGGGLIFGGRHAVAHAVLTAGAVSSIVVDDPGEGYTSAPVVSLIGGGGSGATATASLLGIGVAYVVVNNGGSAYTADFAVTFTGGGGSGAAGTGVVTFGTTALEISLVPTPLDSGEFYEVWATPAFPPGRKFVKPLIRYVTTLPGDSVFPYSLVDAYIEAFGDLPVTTPYKIAVLVNVINQVNGARSGIARSDLIQV
jgi:hypothetical protein